MYWNKWLSETLKRAIVGSQLWCRQMKQRINWSREFLLLLRSSFKQKISFPLFWREIEKSGRIRWKISILPKPEKLWLKDEDWGGGGCWKSWRQLWLGVKKKSAGRDSKRVSLRNINQHQTLGLFGANVLNSIQWIWPDFKLEIIWMRHVYMYLFISPFTKRSKRNYRLLPPWDKW